MVLIVSSGIDLSLLYFSNLKYLLLWQKKDLSLDLGYLTITISEANDIVFNFYNYPAPVVSNDTSVDDVVPVDTSFFCTLQYTEDIIEKNLRQAISLASSKADACRRVMDLEPLGYVVLSNVTDERKAELVNPFASPKFILCGDDFTKARNRRTKQ